MFFISKTALSALVDFKVPSFSGELVMASLSQLHFRLTDIIQTLVRTRFAIAKLRKPNCYACYIKAAAKATSEAPA